MSIEHSECELLKCDFQAKPNKESVLFYLGRSEFHSAKANRSNVYLKKNRWKKCLVKHWTILNWLSFRMAIKETKKKFSRINFCILLLLYEKVFEYVDKIAFQIIWVSQRSTIEYVFLHKFRKRNTKNANRMETETNNFNDFFFHFNHFATWTNPFANIPEPDYLLKTKINFAFMKMEIVWVWVMAECLMFI